VVGDWSGDGLSQGALWLGFYFLALLDFINLDGLGLARGATAPSFVVLEGGPRGSVRPVFLWCRMQAIRGFWHRLVGARNVPLCPLLPLPSFLKGH